MRIFIFNPTLDVFEANLIISLLIIFLRIIIIKNNQKQLIIMNQLKLQFLHHPCIAYYLAKAKFPTNKLIVKPIPVKIDTA